MSFTANTDPFFKESEEHDMTLNSMTGFARVDGNDEAVGWYWEVKTLNGRGLDIRLRLPPGYEGLDQPVREACSQILARGNCSISLFVKREASASELRINDAALEQVIAASKQLVGKVEAAPATIDGLLGLRGVLELVEPEEGEDALEARKVSILNSFKEALQNLQDVRSSEGARLESAIASQVDTIEELVQKAEAAEGRTPDNIKQRLKDQVAKLLESDTQFNEDRLYQEAALIAAKADIEEEIERLKAHIEAARELIASDKPAGRRLDFLTQEFNREANTICSKAGDTEISRIGLDLKATIDQMREQVQNIE